MVRCLILCGCLAFVAGCATMKESDTARTGVEQLLISSSIDRALDKVDFRPITNAKVYVEQKYLDCVDKNYVISSIRHRLRWLRPTSCSNPATSGGPA